MPDYHAPVDAPAFPVRYVPGPARPDADLDWRSSTGVWGSSELDARLEAALSDVSMPTDLAEALLDQLHAARTAMRRARREVPALLGRYELWVRQQERLVQREEQDNHAAAEARRVERAAERALADRVARVRLCAEQNGLELAQSRVSVHADTWGGPTRGRYRLTCAQGDPRYWPSSPFDTRTPPRVRVAGRYVLDNPAGDTLEAVEQYLAHHHGFAP
jgi:hypothetical protein